MSSKDSPVATQGPGNYGDAKAEAKAAKAYAKAQRPWYKKKRWIALIVIVAIIVIVQLGGGDEASGGGDSAKAPAAASQGDSKKAEEPEAKPMAVDAGTIMADYEANEAAADGKYKGQTLLVSGVVEKVDTAVLDEDKYVVRVSDGSDFAILTVNCNGLESDAVASLSKGQQVQVQGDFDDGGDLGVELTPCKIIS